MKNNYTDLFIQHSRKQLSDNQLIEFNQELKNNADFRTAFEEYELTRQFFIQKELFDVKDILNDIKHNPPKNEGNWTKLSIGIFSILMGISAYFLFFNKKESIKIVEKITIENAPITEIIVEEIVLDTTKKAINIPPKTEKTTISTPTEITISSIIEEKKKDSIIVISVPKTQQTEEKKTIISQKNEEKKTENTPCPTISFEIKSTKTCENQATGRLEIVNITGGIDPYNYFFDEKKSLYQTLENVEKGNFEVKVMDKNACSSSKKVSIQSKICIEKHYEFSYTYQDYWTIPIQQKGTFSLFNKEGKLLINLPLSTQNPTDWNGLDTHGNPLATGLYPFIIIIENEQFTGSINIYP